MLALSLAVMAASGGLSFAAALAAVWQTARTAPTDPAGPPSCAVVLGQALDPGGVPSPQFRMRLERARHLAARWPGLRLVILGGRTGGDDVSEAEAGRRHLVAGGVAPERILVEDRSRHTLENLFHYRARFETSGPAPLLITSRFHLARSGMLARGLGIDHILCAAEDLWSPQRGLLLPLLKEALLIQWYVTGRLFAHLTGNRRMAARIS